MVINVRKKLKRETIIRPHWVLLFQGRAFMFLMYAFNVVLLYQVDFRFENIGVMGIILLIVLIPLCVFLNVFFAPHIFGTLKITDESVKFFGLFLPTVKLNFSDIKYIDIRTFKDGNILYGKNTITSTYKFLLISESPLPQKRIDKINSSAKKKIIKYAVSFKLCESIVDKLPELQARIVKYQMHIYKKQK